jgi:hypothetical protein
MRLTEWGSSSSCTRANILPPTLITATSSPNGYVSSAAGRLRQIAKTSARVLAPVWSLLAADPRCRGNPPRRPRGSAFLEEKAGQGVGVGHHGLPMSGSRDTASMLAASSKQVPRRPSVRCGGHGHPHTTTRKPAHRQRDRDCSNRRLECVFPALLTDPWVISGRGGRADGRRD